MEDLQKLAMSEAWLLQSSSQMQQTLVQMHIPKEDKERSIQEIHQLKTTYVELRSQLVEPLPLPLPAGPTEAERWLEEKAQQLMKELDSPVGQL
jgi:hypothetical protein